MVIHIIGTVNGQINEGMRNVATHLAKEFEKENTVLYSNLKQIFRIVLNSKRADVTLIFARANKLVYRMSSIVTKLCKNTWIVLVQKPNAQFIKKNNEHPLNCSYLSITERDMKNVKILAGKQKRLFRVGIKADKFVPVSVERQKNLNKNMDLIRTNHLLFMWGIVQEDVVWKILQKFIRRNVWWLLVECLKMKMWYIFLMKHKCIFIKDI